MTQRGLHPGPATWAACAALVGLACHLAMSGPLAAEPLPCPASPLTVVAPEPGLAAKICTIAEESLPLLADCGLVPEAPVTIEVVSAPPSLPGGAPCLALYDCTENRIAIVHPDAVGALLDKDNPFLELAPTDLFASLIVHELAHALLDQQVPGGDMAYAAHEYTAYALQLDSLPAAARQRLLDAYPHPGPVELLELNDFVALAGPAVFAVKAWRHFSEPGNGCAFVRKLIDGEATLAIPPL